MRIQFRGRSGNVRGEVVSGPIGRSVISCGTRYLFRVDHLHYEDHWSKLGIL